MYNKLRPLGTIRKLVLFNSFHKTPLSRGIEEFYEKKNKPTDVVITGRSWTLPDLRRKGFDDLHKLWYVLYKERNMLLTLKEKLRKMQRPILPVDDFRYTKVKRSMAAIMQALDERRKIKAYLKSHSEDEPTAA